MTDSQMKALALIGIIVVLAWLARLWLESRDPQ